MNDSVFNIVISNANKCNARCPYCISKQTPEVCNNYDKFNYARLQNAIQYAVRAEMLTCKLTGKGDPLCNMSILQFVLNFVQSKFPIIEVQTNGIALDKDIIQILANEGVTVVAISCVHWDRDSNSQLYNTRYEDLKYIISLLHDAGLSVRLSCTLIKGFIDDHFQIDKFLEHFKDDNIEQFSFIPVGYYGDGKHAQWAKEHRVQDHMCWNNIKVSGTLLWKTSYGGLIYDYKGRNVYIADCLSRPVEEIRSLIYYPDGHLRYSWTKPGAIIF